MTREEIINNIRKEGLNIGKNDVLIGIMPTQIQSIVLAYHRYENYVPDFLITSLLSAAATAIGNSFRLRMLISPASVDCRFSDFSLRK